MRYSDIISIKNLPSVFDLQGEVGNNWTEFISNPQFEDILNVVTLSLSKDPIVKQKCIWITGTYGTGKSHASSVIKHLMCDPIEEIEEYIEEAISSKQLQFTIKNHRQNKRYFPVVLKGGEGVKDVNTFSMAIEKAIKSALRREGIKINLQSDFENIISYINTKSSINWEGIIQESDHLRSYVQTKQQLVSRLEKDDFDILTYVKDALAKDKIDLGTLSVPIDEWVIAVQNELREQGVADGLLILWDEFTDIVDANITGLLVAIQDIADRCMHPENDSFLYFITHPKYENNINAEELKKIRDRFHEKKYQMTQVSTYAIMSKKMKVVNKDLFQELKAESLNLCEIIALKLIDGNVQAKNDLLNLFPLHPYTAYLCTFCATHIGSSERSVFSFMLDNQRFKDFFESEELCERKAMMTADYLWDYYFEAFLSDSRKMSHITDRYFKNIDSARSQGEDYESVFKTILLMNALTNLSKDHSGVIPSENNLQFLFMGAKLATPLEEVLGYIHDNRIVQRLPNGLYSIEGASFSSQELEDAAKELRAEYTSAVKVMLYAEDAKKGIDKSFDSIKRDRYVEHYSLDDTMNIHLLNSKLIKQFQNPPSSQLHIGVFYALDQRQVDSTRQYLEEQSRLDEHVNKVFILFKQPLTKESYDQFIETMANMVVALKHKMSGEVTTYRNHAVGIIVEWQRKIIQQHAYLYFRGEVVLTGVQSVSNMINDTISAKIFSSGIEILRDIRKSTDQFWAKYKTATGSSAEFALNYPNLDATESRITTQYAAIKSLFKTDDGGSYIVNSEFKYIESAIIEKHPLVEIQKKVDEVMRKAARTNTSFNFAERLIELASPPYGLYANFPNMFVLAFAMRAHCGELYGATLNKPLSNQQIADLIVDTFKHWAGVGTKLSESKMIVRFGSKEEKELARYLSDVLYLKAKYGDADISDYSSVKDTIIFKFSKENGAPFWVLDYASGMSDGIKDSIAKMVSVIEDTSANQGKIKSAVDSIKINLTDIRLHFQSPSLFMDCYHNFLLCIEDANVLETELEEVKAYIVQNMNPEIGRWDKASVRDKVFAWKVKKLTPVTPHMPSSNVGHSQPINQSSNTANESNNSSILHSPKQKIVSRIKEIDKVDELKELLLTIINDEQLDSRILLKIAELCQ